MQKSLFSFVCDYSDGTYVCQTQESSVEAAALWWIKNLAIEQFIPRVSKDVSTQLTLEFDNDREIVALDGLSNVWQFSTIFEDQFLFVTIIQTENSQTLV